MTQEDFGKVVAFLEGAWGVEMPGKQRDAYWLILNQQPAAQVMAEAVRLAKSSRSRYGLPKPGELLGADDESAATLAWHSLLATLEQHGFYDSVEFGDGVLAACVHALGGWMVVSEWPTGNEREMRVIQRDFERLYTALRKSGAKGPTRFVGEFERHNSEKWPEMVKPPVYIPAWNEDADKALALPGSSLRLLPRPMDES